MNSPLVSVVMPLRNAQFTIEKAIASLRRQSYENLEIILVDHASEDNSPALIKKAASGDKRIRCFRQEGSFVEAANFAWQSSKGELIARMDSDDIAHSTRIENQVGLLAAQPQLSACGTLVNILKRGEDGQPIPPEDGYKRYEAWINSVVTHDQILTERFVDSPIPNPSAMIRRSVMESLGGYQDPLWAEDYDFWLRLLEAGHKIAKVNQRLLDWYDGETRATRTLGRYDLSRFQVAKSHFLKRIPDILQLGVVICGAGPVGKEMGHLLSTAGVKVQAFLEVNERKIGNQIDGIPILDSGELSHFFGRAVVLGAVGQKGGRERIRMLADGCGFLEGKDFFCVA
ncbi:MAG: hypothetical protein CMO61_14155 [Verrucomicrobiales bacterium]|nr:hypothetical protein [Verrucomicrobiales bacterium]|tara:strand:- start:9527 stop:10555 length:1029 start_codon:yes stop_codon:yes gene_type:complete